MRKHVPLTLLILVLLVSAVIRFTLVPYSLWTGDSARDLIVSGHIVRYHEFPQVGHVASFTNPLSFYPPLYYYLLGILEVFTANPVNLIYILTIINIATIALVYFIASSLYDSWAGINASALYAFSTYYLTRATTINSMYVAFPIFLTGVSLHVLGWKRRRLLFTLLSYIPLIAAGSINYAFMLLIPVFLFWSFVEFRTSIERPFLILDVVIATLYVIYAPMVTYMTSQYGFGAVISPFAPAKYVSKGVGFIAGSLSQNIVGLFNEMYYWSYIKFPSVVTGIILAIPVALGTKTYLKKIAYPASFFLFTLFMASIFPQRLPAYIFYGAFVFVYIIFGAGFRQMSMRPVPKAFRIILPCALILFFLFYDFRNFRYMKNGEKTFSQTQYVSGVIASQAESIRRERGLPDYSFFQVQAYAKSNDNWESLQYWYFLERALGKLLIVTNPFGDHTVLNNVKWISQNTPYVFIICLDADVAWCKNHAVSRYPGYRFVRSVSIPNAHTPVWLYQSSGSQTGVTQI